MTDAAGDGGRSGGRPASRRSMLAALGAAATAALAGCPGAGGGGETLTIFHAGSLAPPFARLEEAFEAETGVRVEREARGSVYSTRKLTAEGRRADVLGVSDFRLCRDRLLPDFGSWYALFCSNAVAVHYTPDSPGADAIGTDTWWEVLSRDGVRIGHSDPAADPGGYRAVMAQQLGATPFEGAALYDRSTYDALRANSWVTSDTEINLVSQLQAGKLDYALNYRSVGETADVAVLDLPPQVDLSRATDRYADHYATASVATDTGTYVGAPIAYGVAVPAVAPSPDLGARWVEFVLGPEGREVLRETGFEPIEPAVVPATSEEAVPERVRRQATARSTVGPLEL